jgi:Ca2+-binding EF-hand superfamily protein
MRLGFNGFDFDRRGSLMTHKIKATLLLGVTMIIAGTSLAFAQMDGPPPTDGPMQGLMHRQGRLNERMLAEFDLNHDGKVTHTEFNTVIAKRFGMATHGAPEMTEDQFLALHMPEFQAHMAGLFKRVDWNGDGKITLEEYAEPQRAHFAMMDRDGTGVVTCGAQQSSFGRAADDQNDGESGGRARARGQGGFGRSRFCAEADLNQDGKVTRQEFDTYVAREFARGAKGKAFMTPAEFYADELARFQDANAKMFKRLDRDRTGKITLQEFAAPEEKLFARLDKNNDGVITEDEMNRRPGSRRGAGQEIRQARR